MGLVGMHWCPGDIRAVKLLIWLCPQLDEGATEILEIFHLSLSQTFSVLHRSQP